MLTCGCFNKYEKRRFDKLLTRNKYNIIFLSFCQFLWTARKLILFLIICNGMCI